MYEVEFINLLKVTRGLGIVSSLFFFPVRDVSAPLFKPKLKNLGSADLSAFYCAMESRFFFQISGITQMDFH